MPPSRLLFGDSSAIRELLEQCERYARVREPLLILGPPGTGKTAIARWIHELSRRNGPFISDSASNIPDNLEVSYFSGHARGAFTGAQDQMGMIEAAHRGTFFLDELGDASPRVQQILRQLADNGVVQRMGERRDRPVDVRFIGATNAPLDAMVNPGTFRRDLLDRFGFFKIRMPTLAERRDEILDLVDFFLGRAAEHYGLARPPALSDRVRDCLYAAPWLGNIRELENLCKYVALRVDFRDLVEMADLPPEFLASMGEVIQYRHDRTPTERAKDALLAAEGNKTEAARRHGVSRQHLYRLLRAVNGEG